jgi:hypothetical protein
MARLAKNEVNDGRAMLVEVRSTEGLGVSFWMRLTCFARCGSTVRCLSLVKQGSCLEFDE